MAEDDPAPEGETPMQKALRLKRAAQAASAHPTGQRRGDGERAAAARSSSLSKPWMKR